MAAGPGTTQRLADAGTYLFLGVVCLLFLVPIYWIAMTSLKPTSEILVTPTNLVTLSPTLNHYGAKREDLVALANDLFNVVGSGAVKIAVNQKYPLKDAQKAHRDLEGRGTTGTTILIP